MSNKKCARSPGGPYGSLQECQQKTNCGQQRYSCDPDNGCTPTDDGPYTSMADCQAKCLWDCAPTSDPTRKVCKASTSGRYKTKEECDPTCQRWLCDTAGQFGDQGCVRDDSKGQYGTEDACRSDCKFDCIPISPASSAQNGASHNMGGKASSGGAHGNSHSGGASHNMGGKASSDGAHGNSQSNSHSNGYNNGYSNGYSGMLVGSGCGATFIASRANIAAATGSKFCTLSPDGTGPYQSIKECLEKSDCKDSITPVPIIPTPAPAGTGYSCDKKTGLCTLSPNGKYQTLKECTDAGCKKGGGLTWLWITLGVVGGLLVIGGILLALLAAGKKKKTQAVEMKTVQRTVPSGEQAAAVPVARNVNL